MDTIRAGLIALAIEHQPATVRQVFYLAVSAGLVEKTNQDYKGTVCRLLADARLQGELDWQTIVDHTRSATTLRAFDDLSAALGDTARFYRRKMWRESDVRVEVWCEKQTLSGVLSPVTLGYDIGLFPTRGYPSLSFLYDCAEDIQLDGKPTTIYYFGDWDPSGVDIAENVAFRLRQFSGGDITFQRLAVRHEQIEELGLATRPEPVNDFETLPIAIY